MTNRDFDEWLSKFRPSISSYDYYIDFEKVVRNVEEIKVNQRIIAGNAQFTGIAAGQGVGFTTGLLLLREGLGMRKTPIRPHS